MRIAMFSDNFYPEMSGISDSVIESSRALSRLGHHVDIYAPAYSKKDFARYAVPAAELDLGENIKIHRFFSVRYPAPTGQGRFVIPTFLRWLWMFKNKPDVIHVHDCFGVGIEGLAASWCLNVPLVGTNHTPITEFLKYAPVQHVLISKIALRYVSWFYNRCRFVSAPCKAILEEMKVHGFNKPHEARSNPIDVAHFKPVSPEEKAQAKKEFSLSDFTVLYTGRLAAEKHVDVLIRAVAMAKKQIPMIQLAITGHGISEEGLKKLAKELHVEDSILFFGTVPADKHARIYKAADVFAIASTAEMQSLSLMKAMATGMPVIGVNAWALPEYIHKENGFILEPGDYAGIAEKIILLYKDPLLAHELGGYGSHEVQEFAPEKIAHTWEMTYREASSTFHAEHDRSVRAQKESV